MSSELRLTIVTVAGPGDEELVRKNIEHISRKNHGENYEVHVLDNGCFHGYPPISFKFPNVKIHSGEPPDHTKPNACRGSYQHSSALNRFLREHEIRSPYLLILDPDFYIVHENWIDDVIGQMAARNLSFFGAPWHPKWYSKYRYFPCVHCMFIDANKIDYRHLDFTPDLVERGAKADKRNGLALPGNNTCHVGTPVNVVPRNWLPVFINIVREGLKTLCYAYAEVKQPIPKSLKATMRAVQLGDKVRGKFHAMAVLGASMTVNRRIIGSANDTGYLVERQYAGKQKQIETLLPSVLLPRDFTKPHFLATSWGKHIEALVPDKWRYIPKRRVYFTDKCFEQFDFPNSSVLCWEEFFWRGEPFGVHMRRYNKINRSISAEKQLLQDILDK